ncbi:MAG: hypothetical protein E7157_03620 [Lactobacillales bacterium]|nr:hypothetical protein [Lactobacillales bacterium]
MYCPNCGKEVNEKAVVCVGCGVPINNNYNNLQISNKPKKGKGIASMVLGIIAVFYCLSAFAAFEEIDNALYPYMDSSSGKFGFAIGFVLIQSILAIIGICLAVSERKQQKNGFNASGFWLSIASFAMIAIQFIYVITY